MCFPRLHDLHPPFPHQTTCDLTEYCVGIAAGADFQLDPALQHLVGIATYKVGTNGEVKVSAESYSAGTSEVFTKLSATFVRTPPSSNVNLKTTVICPSWVAGISSWFSPSPTQ